jgi:protein-S-isoprenylcysteine O-methyltransferase Ste14
MHQLKWPVDFRLAVEPIQTPEMCEEGKMRTLSYLLVTVGMVLALGGVVAVFNLDQPSDVFSLAWWMIVGGWCLALTGMGIDIVHLFRGAKQAPAYLFHPETHTSEGVERQSTRI